MKTLLFLLASLTSVSAQLEWRLSAKVFVDQAPTAAQITTFNTTISDWIGHANGIYPRHTRGYRIRLTEVEFIVSTTWVHRAPSAANRDDLQSAATDDPTRFRWRSDAVNLYVTQPLGSSTYSGYCSRPGDEVIIIRDDASNGTLVHELGHFFDLCHTHGCSCGPCDPNTPCSDSDDVVDTLTDSSCWENSDGTADLNKISTVNFSVNYDQLPANLQRSVQNTAINVMSYHAGASVFTPDQFDRMTDASNDARRNVSTGVTWFVDINNGSDDAFFGYYSQDPVQSISEGVQRARTGEIVLIRGGTHPFLGTGWSVSKPVTLRATRGNVTIRPALP